MSPVVGKSWVPLAAKVAPAIALPKTVSLPFQLITPNTPSRETLAGAPPSHEARSGNAVGVRGARSFFSPLRPFDASLALDRLLQKYKLSDQFPADVNAECAHWLQNTGIDDPTLVDRTDLPFVTIDNDDSKDLDQAMCIRRNAVTGGTTVYYALADASYYVRPGSALYREALKRGTSFYVADISIPMLPRPLSEGLISLNEGVDRRALLMTVELDPQGQVVSTNIDRARIRSRKKLSYRGVQQFHDAGRTGALAGKDYSETLELLEQVGRQRIQVRGGSASVPRHEARVDFTAPDRLRLAATEREHLAVESWNEQISVMANAQAAKYMAAGDSPLKVLYKTHLEPAWKQLDKFGSCVSELGRLRNLPDAWKWKRSEQEPLASYLTRLPAEANTTRIADAVRQQAMMINLAARFSLVPAPHYGVQERPYTRMTAPMREIVGIYTHQALLAKRYPERPVGIDSAAAEKLRGEIIQSAEQARTIQSSLQRETYKIAIDQTLAPDVTLPVENRPLHTATVLGVSADKVYVRFDAGAIELKVYMADLERELGKRPTLTPGHAALSVDGAGALITIGDEIRLRTRTYEDSDAHWTFDVFVRSSAEV